jgi:hypothetical protein
MGEPSDEHVLHSVHVNAGGPATSAQADLILISPEDARTAHLTEAQRVVVEKTM